MPPNHWLVKSEPDVFSFDDLWQSPQRTTHWDGIRNYLARNYMRDGMKVGDLVLFYHSNAEPAGIAGVARVAREAYPDPTAFDATHDHFDAKSRIDAPTWLMVDVQAVEPFVRFVSLDEMRGTPGLEKMVILQKGTRLSVTPVMPEEFAIVTALGADSTKRLVAPAPPRSTKAKKAPKSPKSPKSPKTAKTAKTATKRASR
jgi:predicted RNA-binding protein with PUA-like domain